MKIKYQRTGGFLGRMVRYDINVDELPLDEGAELKELIEAVDFFGMPAKLHADEMGFDHFQYTLTIETEKQQHSVDVEEAAVPDNFWPLLEKLRILAGG